MTAAFMTGERARHIRTCGLECVCSPRPKEVTMAVEQKLEIDGEVTEALPNLLFRVKLENDHELLAHLAGKMRRFRIRVLPGDKVRVEVSPYDLNRGRIVYRYFYSDDMAPT